MPPLSHWLCGAQSPCHHFLANQIYGEPNADSQLCFFTFCGCFRDLPCPRQSGWGWMISPERQLPMPSLEGNPEPHSGDLTPLPAPGGLWDW